MLYVMSTEIEEKKRLQASNKNFTSIRKSRNKITLKDKMLYFFTFENTNDNSPQTTHEDLASAQYGTTRYFGGD